PSVSFTLSLHAALPISQALNFVFLALLTGLVFGLILQLNIQLIRMIADQIETGVADVFSLFGAQVLVGVASLVIMIMIPGLAARSEEHTSELQSRENLV